MKTSLKVSRAAQLIGACFFVAIIVVMSQGGDARAHVGWMGLVGLLLIIGPRIYEWLTRE